MGWSQRMWKRDREQPGRGERGRDRRLIAQLVARGLDEEFARLLAPRLRDRIESCDASSREGLLDGVALALGTQREIGQDLTRGVRRLRELERMMSAFSGELGKLDEVLEVLSAYVRRMRSSGTSSSTGREGRGLLN